MKKKIYVAIIDDGLRTRGFKDLKLLCQLFSLDYFNIYRHLQDKGYWSGLNYTIFSVELEMKSAHKGRER